MTAPITGSKHRGPHQSRIKLFHKTYDLSNEEMSEQLRIRDFLPKHNIHTATTDFLRYFLHFRFSSDQFSFRIIHTISDIINQIYDEGKILNENCNIMTKVMKLRTVKLESHTILSPKGTLLFKSHNFNFNFVHKL